MVSNEVFVGANAQVGLCPEMDLYFDAGTVGGSGLTFTLASGQQSITALIPDLYSGCTVKVEQGNASDLDTAYRTVVTNTATAFTLDAALPNTSGTHNLTIMSFGAPAYGPKKSSTGTILSDNWLGLVNTFTPPNVEVEMKQLNLAVAGGRNYDYQYKGAETVSGGSLDLSLNNGSWLYYALGKISSLSGGSTAITADNSSADNGIGYDTSNKRIVRVRDSNIFPEVYDGSASGGEDNLGPNSFSFYNNVSNFVYTFSEADDDILPSFALDVVYRKAGHSATTVLDSNTPNENMYSRIFTGCQVNSLTLNFVR